MILYLYLHKDHQLISLILKIYIHTYIHTYIYISQKMTRFLPRVSQFWAPHQNYIFLPVFLVTTRSRLQLHVGLGLIPRCSMGFPSHVGRVWWQRHRQVRSWPWIASHARSDVALRIPRFQWQRRWISRKSWNYIELSKDYPKMIGSCKPSLSCRFSRFSLVPWGALWAGPGGAWGFYSHGGSPLSLDGWCHGKSHL